VHAIANLALHAGFGGITVTGPVHVIADAVDDAPGKTTASGLIAITDSAGGAGVTLGALFDTAQAQTVGNGFARANAIVSIDPRELDISSGVGIFASAVNFDGGLAPTGGASAQARLDVSGFDAITIDDHVDVGAFADAPGNAIASATVSIQGG